MAPPSFSAPAARSQSGWFSTIQLAPFEPPAPRRRSSRRMRRGAGRGSGPCGVAPGGSGDGARRRITCTSIATMLFMSRAPRPHTKTVRQVPADGSWAHPAGGSAREPNVQRVRAMAAAATPLLPIATRPGRGSRASRAGLWRHDPFRRGPGGTLCMGSRRPSDMKSMVAMEVQVMRRLAALAPEPPGRHPATDRSPACAATSSSARTADEEAGGLERRQLDRGEPSGLGCALRGR